MANLLPVSVSFEATVSPHIVSSLLGEQKAAPVTSSPTTAAGELQNNIKIYVIYVYNR